MTVTVLKRTVSGVVHSSQYVHGLVGVRSKVADLRNKLNGSKTQHSTRIITNIYCKVKE